MCGVISTRNSSPWRSVTLGVLATPTPAGVPVMMTVPGARVVLWERKLTMRAMEKMRSLLVSVAVHLDLNWGCVLCCPVLHDLVVLEAADAQGGGVRDDG